jgi:hypothetical protein
MFFFLALNFVLEVFHYQKSTVTTKLRAQRNISNRCIMVLILIQYFGKRAVL